VSDYFPEPEVALPLFAAAGRAAAEACAAKAARVSAFDHDAACGVILDTLRASAVPMTGESLVDLCVSRGIKPHDQRAFGSVFGTLARRGAIVAVGYAPRRKGHGTSGARLWAAK
jgi:hypothetical protein